MLALFFTLLNVFLVFFILYIIGSINAIKKKRKLEIENKPYLNKKYDINLDEIIKSMKRKYIVSIEDINDDQLLAILFTAKTFEQLLKRDKDTRLLKDKVFCSLFLEPSTRTRCSFDSAILRLGSKVININDMDSTSFYKGETIEDAFKILSSYADGIIYRDASSTNIYKALDHSKKPIINAGNGTGEHPTQSLLDFYTIFKYFPEILERNNSKRINVCFIGDLKNGRTVHSLSKLLSRFNVGFIFVSCKSLEIPHNTVEEIIHNLRKNGFYDGHSSIRTYDNLESGVKEAHVIYMTRTQKERFLNETEYEKYKDAFILDNNIVSYTRSDAIILHPLPRVNEIKTELDSNSKSVYFLQAENGLYVRMALLYLIFS